MSAGPRFLRDLPGPRGVPLLGNALQLDPSRLHRILEEWVGVHGPVFRIRILGKDALVVADPELIQQVLRERPDNYRRIAVMEPVFREMGLAGLIPSEGDNWRRQRRIWMASLNAAQIRPFMPQLGEVTARLRRRWLRAAAAGEAVDARADLKRYTVDVTMRFALGHDPNTLEQDGDVIQNYLSSVFPAIGRRINTPFPYWRFFKLPADRKLDRDLATLRRLVGDLIEQARRRQASAAGAAGRPANLIEALLAARDEDGSRFSDNEIYSNVLSALLAGEDTTANTMAWIMHFLALHPEVQTRLRREVREELGEEELSADHARSDALRYVDAVMGEALRLKLPAPMMVNTTVRDVELGGIRLPAGTDVFSVFRPAAREGGRNPEPERFQPERWLTQPAHAYVKEPPMPFGGGPRVCPGRSLATTEIRSILTMLARSFALEPVEGGPPVAELLTLTMEPTNLRLRLRPLDGAAPRPGTLPAASAGSGRPAAG